MYIPTQPITSCTAERASVASLLVFAGLVPRTSHLCSVKLVHALIFSHETKLWEGTRSMSNGMEAV